MISVDYYKEACRDVFGLSGCRFRTVPISELDDNKCHIVSAMSCYYDYQYRFGGTEKEFEVSRLYIFSDGTSTAYIRKYGVISSDFDIEVNWRFKLKSALRKYTEEYRNLDMLMATKAIEFNRQFHNELCSVGILFREILRRIDPDFRQEYIDRIMKEADNLYKENL